MKRWIKYALVALVALLLAAGVLRALSARKAQQAALAATSTDRGLAAVDLLPADLFTATPADLRLGLPVTGTVRAVNSAVLKARVAGEVQGLTVREGDRVKAGQVLARIEATEYQARLRQAQQQADAARAQIEIAQRQYDNNRALVDQGFISRTALDTSEANLAAARASFEAAAAGAAVTRKALDDTVLRAPIDGQVSARLAQPGERVAVDARIVEIVDLSRLEVEASLSVGDALDVQLGQRATLELQGADDRSRRFGATVARINPAVQAGSRGVLVYLALDADNRLRQGSFVQGTLATGTRRALAVPVSAVRTDRPQPYVQVLRDGQVAYQPVQTGLRAESDSEPVVAVTGLAEGAVVIRGTVGLLREGTRARAATMARGAASTPAPAASR